MRIWWFKVITELQYKGLTIRSQADELGVSVGSVAHWKNGGEPGWHNGQRLLGLYTAHTGNTDPPCQATAYST